MTDEDWVWGIKEGKDDVLDDLFNLLVGYFMNKRTSIDRCEYEDIAQDSVIKIWWNIDDFEYRSKFTTWAVAIAEERAIEVFRLWKNQNQRRLEFVDDILPEGIEDKSDIAIYLEQVIQKLTGYHGDTAIGNKNWIAERDWAIFKQYVLFGDSISTLVKEFDTTPSYIYKCCSLIKKRLREERE